ncbi:MAG: hypothetical protein AAF546_07125 [Verrucomicrobiota bacterium]
MVRFGKIYFSYHHDGNGRSGHALKNLFTSVILAEIMAGRTVFNETWRTQNILPESGVRRILLDVDRAKCAEFEFRHHKKQWEGISYDEFRRFVAWVLERRKRFRNTLIELRGIFRIHLSQVYVWEIENKLKSGTHRSIVKTLRKMYWDSEAAPTTHWPPRTIAIHARRGDVANPEHKLYATRGPGSVWNCAFYQSCVDSLKLEFPDSEIIVYSENEWVGDLKQLSKVTLKLGGPEDLSSHIRAMLSADLFIPSDSGLSVWIAHLSEARIRVYQGNQICHFYSYSDKMPSNFESITL